MGTQAPSPMTTSMLDSGGGPPPRGASALGGAAAAAAAGTLGLAALGKPPVSEEPAADSRTLMLDQGAAPASVLITLDATEGAGGAPAGGPSIAVAFKVRRRPQGRRFMPGPVGLDIAINAGPRVAAKICRCIAAAAAGAAASLRPPSPPRRPLAPPSSRPAHGKPSIACL
jgi:hypothetical protein